MVDFLRLHTSDVISKRRLNWLEISNWLLMHLSLNTRNDILLKKSSIIILLCDFSQSAMTNLGYSSSSNRSSQRPMHASFGNYSTVLVHTPVVSSNRNRVLIVRTVQLNSVLVRSGCVCPRHHCLNSFTR